MGDDSLMRKKLKRIVGAGLLCLFGLGVIGAPSVVLASDPSPQKPWSAGATMGFLANTPDDTAFALNFNAEAKINKQLSIGPLLQLGFTDDLTLVGISGQGKYDIGIPDVSDRFKVILQGGIGFVHADVGPSDTSFLIPIGVGVDYQINPGLAFKSDLLLNFTDLDIGRGRGHDDTNVMPSLTFGVRF
jgi:hypothetical protein